MVSVSEISIYYLEVAAGPCSEGKRQRKVELPVCQHEWYSFVGQVAARWLFARTQTDPCGQNRPLFSYQLPFFIFSIFMYIWKSHVELWKIYFGLVGRLKLPVIDFWDWMSQQYIVEPYSAAGWLSFEEGRAGSWRCDSRQSNSRLPDVEPGIKFVAADVYDSL
jgi:hypothetical protein